MLPDMTQQLMIHKPTSARKTTLTPDGSRLAALSNKSWYSMNFTLLLPCSLPPPEHGMARPRDHRLAFDAERIPQHRRISSDTAPDHTNWTKQIGEPPKVGGMNPGVVQPPGKSPLGTLRGQRFERAPFLRVRSHSLPGLPQYHPHQHIGMALVCPGTLTDKARKRIIKSRGVFITVA